MDDQQLKQALHNLAIDEVPDDVDLWERIRGRLVPSRIVRTRSHARRSRWTLLLFLVIGVAVFALVQASQPPQIDLTTPLNLSQTVNGKTVYLDRAYADADRVVLSYRLPPNTAPTVRLTDSQGSEFQPVAAGRFNARSVIDGSPEQLDLRLQVIFPDGTADFDFTVPFYPTFEFAEAQTVTVDGIAVRLEALSVTPSRTRARLCYNQPGWEPRLTAQWDDTVITPESVRLRSAAPCAVVIFEVPYQRQPGQLTLHVDRLVSAESPDPAAWARFKDVLAAQNIEIELNDTAALSYAIRSDPRMTDDQYRAMRATIDRVREETLREVIRGPWVFRVDLP